MTTSLSGSKLVLGVSGSIAAYKAAELVRLLKKAGAEVQVIMTADAERFIPALTLSTLSGKNTLVEIFPEQAEGTWTQHIELGLWADLFVVAPATAQTIAKLAHGFCDNMLTAVALAARCPMLVCPAMDHDMYVHPATQANLKTLDAHGYHIKPPEHGELASGLIGTGRLPAPTAIVDEIAKTIALQQSTASLQGQHVLVTAGPTQESLDPVRFISNHSTGTMGYALAAAAQQRGATVTLISGPTDLETPAGVQRIDVLSAADMAGAVAKHDDAHMVIMTAAVADYTPAEKAQRKIKKGAGDLNLTLTRTQDILAGLGANKKPGQVLVGFALETDNLEENARRKLEKKNLDWIVLNSPNNAGEGFGTTTNRVTLFSATGTQKSLPLMDKAQVAVAILDEIEASTKHSL
ncbi:MAG: bifunctional phosphopantothenoylcysteine decarboxylase/phosphopantothenate--cysteine ligase CoaBC [Bacteroidota bacterium]